MRLINTYILSIFISLLFLSTKLWAQVHSTGAKHRVLFGVHGGANITQPQIIEQHNVLVPLQVGTEGEAKQYGKLMDNLSNQFGFSLKYCFSNHFSLIATPGIFNYRFEYLSNYTYNDAIYGMNLEKEMKHRQLLTYISAPLYIRWDFLKRKFTPYLQLGAFGDYRYKISKSVYMDGIIDHSVDIKDHQIQTETIEANAHFKRWNYGVTAGVGFSYTSRLMMIALDCNTRYSLANVVNDRNRYSDLTGFTSQYLDVLDQLKLHNLNVQLHLIFPLYAGDKFAKRKSKF